MKKNIIIFLLMLAFQSANSNSDNGTTIFNTPGVKSCVKAALYGTSTSLVPLALALAINDIPHGYKNYASVVGLLLYPITTRTLYKKSIELSINEDAPSCEIVRIRKNEADLAWWVGWAAGAIISYYLTIK